MKLQTWWKENASFLNKNYVIITLSNALYTFALTVALVQLTLHSTTTLGMTMTLFGLVATANSAVVLLMRPFAGYLTSKFDIRLINFVSMLIMAVAYMTLGMSAAVVVFVIGQIIRGVAFGIVGTVLPAMVRNSVPEKQYSQALGFYFMVPMIAVIPAPAISMALYNAHGFIAPASLGAVITVIAAVLSLFGKYTLDETSQTKEENAESVPAGKKQSGWKSLIALKALPFMVANIFIAMCYAAIMNNMLVFDKSIGLGFYTLWATVYSTVSIFSSAISGVLARKIGNKATILICIAFIASSLALYAFTQNYALYILGAVLYALGHMGVLTPMVSASVATVEPSRAATATGTMYMGADLGGIIAGVVIGSLVDSLGFHNMFAVAMGAAVVAFIIILTAVRSKKVVAE